MACSSLLFITLTVSLSALGNLLKTSHSSVQVTQSAAGNSSDLDSLFSQVIFHSESSVEGSGHDAGSTASRQLIDRLTPKGPQGASDENQSTSGIPLTTTRALIPQHSEFPDQGADKVSASITGYTDSILSKISDEAFLEGSHITTEEHLKQSHTSSVKYDFPTGWDRPKIHSQTNVFPYTTNHNLSGPGVFKNFNGTSLLWDDMRRTLAFAWELHVFGSASLFTLMTGLAVLGVAGACTLPNPLCSALTQANSLLIIGGSLRSFLLLLDPYGTCQVLSHATLAALHNVPLVLFLWAQVALTLISLQGLKLLLFPLKVQRPWVVGGLAIWHCTALLVADLYSSALSLALPLLLQTLSLCWGLPFCLGILTMSLSHIHPFLGSSVPQWIPSQGADRRGKRVTAVCAFFGVLCCGLQTYSLFWLYGLLGNWRRFGWGWWLSQFWARILEVAWGFSLLVLGSWIFWAPSRGNLKADCGQSRGEVPRRVERKNLWDRLLARVRKGPLRQSEKTWEDLMPNNWTKHNLTRAGISNNVMCPYDDQPTTIMQEYSNDPVSCSSSDSQAALLWQKIGERECVLSIIEFDMRPPSPINLRRSIDNALHHGQLVAGGLFTPPPPSWIHTMGKDTTDGDGGPTAFCPAYVNYGWMLDTESISASLDHFQAKEAVQSPTATTDYNGSRGSPEEFSTVICQHDWSDDDITDL
ncbi:proline-rich transmembrane protein 3-like isoform X2 [Mugil cephalus]|nr:proline-rich transmembrane protein 3-like isoform X2 [Mugil cephalus]